MINWLMPMISGDIDFYDAEAHAGTSYTPFIGFMIFFSGMMVLFIGIVKLSTAKKQWNLFYDDRDKKLLFAVAGDKDYEPMIRQICENLDLKEVYVTALDSSRGISSEYIAGLFRMYLAKKPDGKEIAVYYDDDIRNAFLRGVASVKGTDGILFCVGSLYLIGSIKKIAAEVL